MEKVCPVCGTVFYSNSSIKICCCETCRRKRNKRMRKGQPISDKEFYTNIKVCPVCGSKFNATDPRKIYCSKKCRKKVHHKNEYDKKLQQRKKQVCIVCGKEFINTKGGQKTCSEQCSLIHKREYIRIYYVTNKDKLNTNSRAWYDKHIEEKKKYDKERYKKNKEEVCARAHKWRIDNKEYIKQKYEENKPKRNARLRERYKKDTVYRLNQIIRSWVHRILKSEKSDNSFKIVGYNGSQLQDYLESLFYGGMSWDNMDSWEIHHIVPINEICKENKDDIECIRLANALDNLIPLFKDDHLEITKIYNSKGIILTREQIYDIIINKK